MSDKISVTGTEVPLSRVHVPEGYELIINDKGESRLRKHRSPRKLKGAIGNLTKDNEAKDILHALIRSNDEIRCSLHESKYQHARLESKVDFLLSIILNNIPTVPMIKSDNVVTITDGMENTRIIESIVTIKDPKLN